MTLWTSLALMLATIVQELNKGILSAVEMVTHLMETFQNQGEREGQRKEERKRRVW